MTLDSVRVALRGILANRLRSGLTMLGILIGTAAVILLVAVGTGISNMVQDRIRVLGTNAIYVVNERNTGGLNRGGTSTRAVRLTKADVKALSDRSRAPDVNAVAPVVGATGTVTWHGTSYALQNFIGATPVFGEIRNAFMHSGRWLTDDDEAAHAKVAVIGTTVVDHVFGKGFDPIGQQVEFNGVRFRIVGLLAHQGTMGTQDQDDIMIAPLSTVIDSIVGNVDSYTMIIVQATARDRLPATMAQITTTLRQTHNLAPGEPPDFVAVNAASLAEAGKAAAKAFQILLAVVAAISLLVGGIGVMNIMLVTVTERTREIGIRRALGARKSDILTQFLTEAVFLAALGGILGIIVGVSAGHLQVSSLRPIVSPLSVALSFAVSVLIGIFFGAYPAGRAASLTPIDALRYE